MRVSEDWIRNILKSVYYRYHHPKYIVYDPIYWVHKYNSVEDKEIVGLLSALMAFGRAQSFNKKIHFVLSLFDSPYRDLPKWNLSELKEALAGFKYRFVGGVTIAKFLFGLRRVIEERTRLGNFFQSFLGGGSEEQFWNGIQLVVEEIQRRAEDDLFFFLPQPKKGGACKRICLYLRWMVRRDEIDIGCWDFISPRQLFVPLDTHVYHWGKLFHVIHNNAINFRAVLDLTRFFRIIEPQDPLKYDFSLCMAGMLGEHMNLDLIGKRNKDGRE